jgi:cytochrome c oxidase subunit II
MWGNLFQDFSFFPEGASTLAWEVDALYLFAVAITVVFTILIFVLMIGFAVKYRRKDESYIPEPIHGSAPLEIFWSIVPFVITQVLFGWGAYVFFKYSNPPAAAMDIHVVGKQWMWKIQHPEGKREINELHVPVDQPVRLIMTSEDVLHSFFIPAFRIKRDTVPGRYTTMWFEATKVGEYHLFCAEYCGNEHSRMIGRVTVLSQGDYDQWLRSEENGPHDPQAAAGERLFSSLRCDSCHGPQGVGRAPSLAGVFGTTVTMANGARSRVDEAYIRESILDPRRHVVAGFQPTMPTFQGQVNEEQILELIAYIKTLGAQ